MSDGIPFRSRHRLCWQVVLVHPGLLRAAERQLQATGPSHAIDLALRHALGRAPADVGTSPEPERLH